MQLPWIDLRQISVRQQHAFILPSSGLIPLFRRIANRLRMSHGATASTPRRRLHSPAGPSDRSGHSFLHACCKQFRRKRDSRRVVRRLLQRGENRPNVVAVFPGNCSAMFAHFLDDRITAGHCFGSISSSGVQMIGGTIPAARTTSSILPRMLAFARCRRFQVTRYSMPCTAAIPTCAASIPA